MNMNAASFHYLETLPKKHLHHLAFSLGLNPEGQNKSMTALMCGEAIMEARKNRIASKKVAEESRLKRKSEEESRLLEGVRKILKVIDAKKDHELEDNLPSSSSTSLSITSVPDAVASV